MNVKSVPAELPMGLPGGSESRWVNVLDVPIASNCADETKKAQRPLDEKAFVMSAVRREMSGATGFWVNTQSPGLECHACHTYTAPRRVVVRAGRVNGGPSEGDGSNG